MAALIEFYSRRFEAAEVLYRETLSLDRSGGVEFVGSVRFISALGFILINKGDIVNGKGLLNEACLLDEHDLARAPHNPERLYSLSASQAALGNSRSAISGLCAAIDAGWIDYRSTELDPRFDSIRNAVEFRETIAYLKQKIQTMKNRARMFTQ